MLELCEELLDRVQVWGCLRRRFDLRAAELESRPEDLVELIAKVRFDNAKFRLRGRNEFRLVIREDRRARLDRSGKVHQTTAKSGSGKLRRPSRLRTH